MYPCIAPHRQLILTSTDDVGQFVVLSVHVCVVCSVTSDLGFSTRGHRVSMSPGVHVCMPVSIHRPVLYQNGWKGSS